MLFESGAILIYLAEKTGKLMPTDPVERLTCLQWVMFQMGGVGPMFGQYNHFAAYAPEKLPYAIERYTNEVKRLHRVLDKRLDESVFLAGAEYGIADIASFPWVRNPERRGIDLADYPAVKRWHDVIAARPAVQRGVEVLAASRRVGAISDKERENMFGGDAVRGAVGRAEGAASGQDALAASRPLRSRANIHSLTWKGVGCSEAGRIMGGVGNRPTATKQG